MSTVNTINKVKAFMDEWSFSSEPTSIQNMAFQALNGMDFPTTRVEDWKYTRVSRIANKTFVQNKNTVDASPYYIKDATMHRLVFVNGNFDEEQSSILEDSGLSFHKIHDLDENFYHDLLEDVEENVFSLINKAFSEHGFYLQFHKNQKTEYPVHIVHLNSGEQTVSNTRFFFYAEAGSKAEVIATFNTHETSKACFTNIALEGFIEENACLEITKVQAEQNDCFHISSEQFFQDPNSNFKINTITIGGLLIRNGLNVLVEGENCYTELNGVYLGKENQHIDNHTFVDHLYGNCVSSETYKGVMDDKSTGVFNGKVVVRPNAQKIEAYQSNGNILMSPNSTINSKPELEIYADDVKCSHGSTTGQLDEKAIFYLKSRGISEKGAKQLLVGAFIGEVLNKIQNESLRSYIDELFLQHYGWEF